MKQLLLLLSLTFCAILILPAQTTSIRSQFAWEDVPTDYVAGSERIQQWAFEGAKFGDRAPSHPYWIHRFPVSSLGDLDIEVRNIATSPLDKRLSQEDQELSNELIFHTSVIREASGRYMAKITCVPILRQGSSFQRVDAMELNVRFEPRAVPRGGGGTETSALSTGSIYRIAIAETGMHKLTYTFLKNDLGISDLDNIDPRDIQIFGNGGGHVPYNVTVDRPDDLVENAVRIVGEEDGSFDSGDFILLYAEGPHKWSYDNNSDRFERETNIYDTRNYYFIKTGGAGQGLRIAERPSLSQGEYTTTTYDGVFRIEEDRVNALHQIEETATGTGQHWYGDFFKISREKDYPDLFDLPGLQTNEPAILRAEMALRATVGSRFFLDIDGQTVQSNQANDVPIGSTNEIYNTLAPTAFLDTEINLSDQSPDLTLRYPHPGGSAQSSGWLDFIQLRARLALQFNGSQLAFRDTRSLAQASAQYTLSNTDSGVEVWDISNPLNPIHQLPSSDGSNLTFATTTENGLQEFVAFRANGELLSAEVGGVVPNQNLHGISGADLLIVYHPDFIDAAQRLANHRANHSGLRVAMAPVGQVYNEFSSGRVDPTAIRDFAKLLFERDPGFSYLLLVGDGSFDCRDLYDFGANFVPVYQRDRNHELTGYPADDYFGIFFGAAGSDPLSNDLSISVGRLPVKTVEEADAVVAKIVNYELLPSNLADWRTRMLFVGDDEDSATHSDDADLAAELIRDSMPFLNATKLYLDLFPQQSTPAGDRFPTVTEEIDRSLFKGVLAVTYLGHGGPRGWAQERILDIPTIQNWENEDALPIFLTATCTFGDYDNGAFVSAGEELLLNPRGGAIGLLTTTRPVFANRNSALTNRSLAAMVSRKEDGSWATLGDIVREAKNSLSSPNNFDNERKFMLMGDPTMIPALPSYLVQTSSVNGISVDPAVSITDTLRALELVTITGEVTDIDGTVLDGFNGTVFPTIYDKRVPVNTLRNDDGSPARTYMVRRNILFKGKATVENGRFTFSFVMPKDINYAFGPGKISYYARDLQEEKDAFGAYEGVIIGGTNPEVLTDDEGPLVEVYMNSEDFIAGSQVDPDPTLLVQLSDDLGINVTGNSIGHDLEGFLNEDTQNSYLLNDFYEAATDDYTKGEVRFPLRDLAPGSYSMKVRAWDVANNLGEGRTEFIVADDGKIALDYVLNYPNPFTDRTCFQFDTNIAGEDLEVMIQIYTVSGRLVKTLQSTVPAIDGSLRLDDCIEWDGRDDYGDQLARGVYLYQVRVRTNGGVSLDGESDFEKLVILK